MWDKLKEQLNLLKLEKKKLCLVTNSDKFVSQELFLDAIASAIQGGVDVVQLKETSFPDNVLAEIAKKVRILCDEYGATFIVNSRCDIAQISEADGVHLEPGCVKIQDARNILGEQAIIGISTSTTEEIIKAYNEGVDYISFGPVCTTKKRSGKAVDINDIKWINENIDIPVFIMGDIDLDNISAIVQTGASKIVVANPLMYAQIPEETAHEFLRFLP